MNCFFICLNSHSSLEFRGICWKREYHVTKYNDKQASRHHVAFQLHIRSCFQFRNFSFTYCNLTFGNRWKQFLILLKKRYVLPSFGICLDKMCHKFNRSCVKGKFVMWQSNNDFLENSYTKEQALSWHVLTYGNIYLSCMSDVLTRYLGFWKDMRQMWHGMLF